MHFRRYVSQYLALLWDIRAYRKTFLPDYMTAILFTNSVIEISHRICLLKTFNTLAAKAGAIVIFAHQIQCIWQNYTFNDDTNLTVLEKWGLLLWKKCRCLFSEKPEASNHIKFIVIDPVYSVLFESFRPSTRIVRMQASKLLIWFYRRYRAFLLRKWLSHVLKIGDPVLSQMR